MPEGVLTRWFGDITSKARDTSIDYSHEAGIKKHAERYVDAVGHGLRQYAEAGLTGMVLGAVQAENSTGLDYKGTPIDGVAAGLGFVANLALANHPDSIGQDMRNVGATAFGILTCRKIDDVLSAKKALAASAVHGDDPNDNYQGDRVRMGRDSDPIVRAHKELLAKRR